MDPISAALNLGTALIEKLFPDPTQQAQAKLELLKLQQSGDLAQIAVNQVEAANSNVFVAGWRPAAAWVCVLALFFQYIVRPLAMGIATAAGHPMPPLPGIDDNLWQLLAGMLGLGVFRTVEKVKGVTK